MRSYVSLTKRYCSTLMVVLVGTLAFVSSASAQVVSSVSLSEITTSGATIERVLEPGSALQPATLQWHAVFTASPDHAGISQGVPIVSGYDLVATPTGGTALAPISLGKPTPDGTNTIDVNVNTQFNALPAGTYTAVVRAVGPGGTTSSATSDPFSLTVPAPGAVGKPGVIKR
jgi:hypothetical protein